MSNKNTETAAETMAALLEDDAVTEIMINSFDQVFVERHGKLEPAGICFADDQQVIHWANGLLASNGFGPVGPANPWVEGRLRNGDRMVVVTAPISLSGPVVTIRKFFRQQMTFEQLLQYGSLSQPILDFLRVVMRAPLNVLVSGATASGKTTFTNMLTELMPEDQRLVVVEWMNELRVRQKHVVYLEAQSANVIGDKQIAMRDLLQLASHMRPDRILVGELAGDETAEMLRLMNTGHEGMVSLIHATSPRDALSRLEKLATVAEPSLRLPAIRADIAQAIHLILQIARLDDGSRRVVSVTEVQGLKGDNIVLQDLFVWEPSGVAETGRLTGAFKATGATPSFAAKLAAMGLPFPKDLFEA